MVLGVWLTPQTVQPNDIDPFSFVGLDGLAIETTATGFDKARGAVRSIIENFQYMHF